MGKKLKNNTRSGVVAIIGRPNVGKSTLLNTVLGEKVSIVSKVPQTTRFCLRGVYNDERGQIVFLDTPGIHLVSDSLSKKLNLLAMDSLIGADCVLYIVDLQRQPGEEETGIVEHLKKSGKPVIMALNKMDLGSGHESKFIKLWEQVPEDKRPRYFVPISAVSGRNVEELIQAIFEFLPEGTALFSEDVLTDFPRKLAIADIIREKLLINLRHELPHESAVYVEQIEDKGKNLSVIYATVIVNHDSQKSIVIGKNGQMIKKIGSLARADIEEIYEKKVFLDLKVRVEHDWIKNTEILKTLGYVGI